MKVLLWILVVVNVVFFAVMQWGGILLSTGATSPTQPLINAEKIKILPASAVISAPVIVSAVVSASEPSLAASHVPAANTASCLEWSEFSGGDLLRANAMLSALNIGNKLAQRQVEYTSGFWAYIPPAKTRAAADKKSAELKARGVDHFIVLESGKWHNAISLGVFKTDDAARKFLDKLSAQGIKAAQVGERLTKLKFTVFMLKELEATEVEKIKSLQIQFPGSQLKAMPCSPDAVVSSDPGSLHFLLETTS